MDSECKFGNLTSLVSPQFFLTVGPYKPSLIFYQWLMSRYKASVFFSGLALPSFFTHHYLLPSYLSFSFLIQLAFPPYLFMFTLITSPSFSTSLSFSLSFTIIRLNTTELSDLGPSVVWLVSNIMNPYVRKHFLVWRKDEWTNYLSFKQEARWSQSV